MPRILSFFVISIVAVFLSTSTESANTDEVLRLATTTSVENSGLLGHLLPRFSEKYPYHIKLTVVGSGKALRMGRSGDVDVVLVHSPPAEMKFVDDGYGINHHTIMRNDFILAGPPDDPGNIVADSHIIEAFQHIAARQLSFVSRGDDSGTNKKELSLWKLAGIDPYGADWYIESGNSMAASLKMAEKTKSYIIIDRATFMVRKSGDAKIILDDPVHLSNPYSIIAVNPEKISGVNFTAANRMIDWLTSTLGQNAIAEFFHKDQQLYHPTIKQTK